MTRIEAKEDELNDVLAMVTLLPLTIVGAPISLERPDFRLVLADGRKISLEAQPELSIKVWRRPEAYASALRHRYLRG